MASPYTTAAREARALASPQTPMTPTVNYLEEDFRAFPFQSQHMLVELQTATFRDTSAVEFWAFLSPHATAAENAEHLPKALQYAVDTIHKLEEVAQFPSAQHPRSMLSLLKAHFRAILFHDAHQAQVFCQALEVLCSSLFLDARSSASLDVSTLRNQLHYLEWMHIAKGSIMKVFLRQIDQRIAKLCCDNFADSFVADIKAWIDTDLLQDAHNVFSNPTTHEPSIQYADTLQQHVYRAFGSLRIQELFEIVREYPESLAAIQDLAQCLDITHQHAQLLTTFQAAIRSRVLQPGASTTSIIDVYTRTIKTFRVLDPRGLLLQRVGELFNHYLRQRKDTIRCIVTSLTDEENGELFEELTRDRRVEPVVDSDDDDLDEPPELWQPEPIEASLARSSAGRRVDDILSSLVNIYGSQDLFVSEYRMMLADRLLLSKDFNTDRDVRTLELLKLRFGDASLQQCDIMVKDIEESKRLQTNLGAPVDATVVSEHFWPPFQGDEFCIHPHLDGMIQTYKDAYGALKSRTLDWIPYLGFVDLELELNGDVVEFSVSQVQASIISHFESRDAWAISELAKTMQVDESVLLKHARYWCTHGVLLHDGHTLTLNNHYNRALAMSAAIAMDDPVETSVSAKMQADEEVKMLESYIKGMLRQFETLSLQKIESKLALISRSGPTPYGNSVSSLTLVLRNLVDQGVLEYIGGQYQLHKIH
ncbi:Aste57867_2957 [Aphanomyces stellatus]|uniref:Anaphase-promoting complex subunit 2 n=1 Tax=Aphanomyces stellatus TaxID=120398 RepID=A0A485K9Q9_9STRA|nr:hypothetical protein As57867_002948 [Aphanomyces stellatus]VFT80140.1 Aste57867_2957 [Aphanomyces stellatus]